jgi:TrmH family RNA methyltransferase
MMRARPNQAEPKPGRTAPLDLSSVITSRDNRWLKAYREALRGSRPRENSLVGLEGPHLIEEAVRSGLKLESILVSPAGEKHLRTLEASMGSGLEPVKQPQILRTTEKLFTSLAGTDTPQGIAALAAARTWSFEDLLRGDVPLVVVMGAVQDPGNVGTILRSSEAFGATGAIAARGTAYPLAPKALRASAGSALRIPLLEGIAAPVALAQLRLCGLTLLAASSHNHSRATVQTASPSQTDLRGPTAIIIGNEGSGLPPELIDSVDGIIAVPLAPAVESLNAAIAASVILYEAARQRSAGRMS